MPESIKNKLKSAVIEALFNLGLMNPVNLLPYEYRFLAGKKIPLFIDQDFSLCFKLDRAPSTHRVFVLTIPKSGTYLITEILEKMGMVNCGVHIAFDHIQDNRFADEDILRVETGRYYVPIPFNISTKLIKQGQFAFGHIPHTVVSESLLAETKKIFSYRNIRDIIVSLVRYYDSREQNYAKPEKIDLYNKFKGIPMGDEKFKAWYDMWGKEFADLFRGMLPWKDRDDVFQIKFETLMGDDGKESQISLVRDLAGFVGLEITEEAANKALTASIGSDTITYSGRRSLHSEWWNDELEDLFVSYGLNLLNKDFGYD